MGHNNAVSGHPISTSFLQVDSWSTRPLGFGMSQLHSRKIYIVGGLVDRNSWKRITIIFL